MKRLTGLFGSNAEIAKITGVSTSAVARWGRYKIAPSYQKKLIVAAYDLDLDLSEVAQAMGTERCPACGVFHLGGRALS
jgi:DNA-directed RNA polymerase specialized sigma24 family protein